MGRYTAHWQEHRRRSIRGLVYVLLWFVLALPAVAAISFGVERVTGEFPAGLLIGLLLAWLVGFTVMVLRFGKVTCPKCNARFTQGRGVTRCLACGLGIGQEEP